MLVLAIWIFLIGYTIAWTGKMNLGVSYKPQNDGSIKAVDDKGNPAKTYTLMDAITCGEPSGTPGGATTGSSPPVAQDGPITVSRPSPGASGVNLGPIRIEGTQSFGLLPDVRLYGPGEVNARNAPASQNFSTYLDNFARGVHNTLDRIPVIGGILNRVFGL